MPNTPDLARCLTGFFGDHLVLQRGASRHTVLGYRDAVKLFLRFAATRVHRAVPDLTWADLDVEAVLAFLDALEQDRRNCVATRNHRRAALHAFFRYVGSMAPEQVERCRRILAIPAKRGPTRAVDYLERPEVESLLAHVDRATARGRRDYALLAFLYNTGARVQEALDLRAVALQLDRPYQVRLLGKGRKERLCPLWPQTAALLRALLAERGVAPHADAPVFVNHFGQPLTRYGVRHLLARYAAAAARVHPGLARKRVHPHTLRHSCAVHLLQAGVDLNLIRSWLGHVSLQTTHRYAEIDLAMKRQALEQVPPLGTPGARPKARWHHNETILAWLETL
jgi:site-specific recombinase XerD